MPTTATTTYSNSQLLPYMNAEDANEIHVQIAPNLTLAKGTVLGEITASPGVYKAYASGNVDGSQVPKVILQYAATTDASGNITWVGEFGVTSKSVPAYYRGDFLTTDLVGLDANAVTVMAGRLIAGTVASGILHLG